MENMTAVDIGVLALIILLSLKGLINGFIKEISGLIGIIGGIYIGTRLGHEAGLYINENLFHLQNESVIVVTGSLAIFIIFWVGMTILGNMLSLIMNKAGLGIVNMSLGFLFAGTKIALIVSIIIHALLSVKVIDDSLVGYTEDSVVIPELKEIGGYIVNADFSAVVNKTEEETGLEGLSEVLEDTGESLSETISEVEEKVEEAIQNSVDEQVSEATEDVVNSVTDEVENFSEE